MKTTTTNTTNTIATTNTTTTTTATTITTKRGGGMLKRKQFKVMNLDIRKVDNGSFSLKDVEWTSMSESFILNTIKRIEDEVHIPAIKSQKLIDSAAECKNISGKKAKVVTKAKAMPIVKKTEDNRLYTILSLKFEGRDTKVKSSILSALEKGIRCTETGEVYQRTFRTPSNFRAGGVMLSLYPEKYREIFSFGLEKGGMTDFEVVPSKFESALTLGLTNSLRIPMRKNPNICVVEDLVRIATVEATGVAEGVNQTTHTCFDGYDVKGTNDNFKFNITTGKKKIELTLTDGNGLVTPEFMARIRDHAMRGTEEELAYFNAIQFRMPYMKGMLVSFDILAYCKENNIHTIIDIYGREWAVEDIDMLIPESVFKGKDYYSSIEEYTEKVLNGSFQFTKDSITKEFKYYENFDYLYVANVNAPKKEYNPMTYQYLQSLGVLTTEKAITLTNEIFGHVRQCTTDINSARALLGMIGSEQEEVNGSMVSILTYLLDLKPELFNESFIQKRILKLVERLVKDQVVGRVMVKGAYHFIISDPTLLLHGSVNGVLDGRNRPVLAEDEKAGIIEKGYIYQAGKEHGTKAAGFRSPLIYESESALVTYQRNDSLDKWLGHLKGLVIFNGYDPLALSMGGASL